LGCPNILLVDIWVSFKCNLYRVSQLSVHTTYLALSCLGLYLGLGLVVGLCLGLGLGICIDLGLGLGLVVSFGIIVLRLKLSRRLMLRFRLRLSR
jgi:hypothetical protein